MMLVMFRDSLIFSHHIETVIARLKILAPVPKPEDIPFETEAPQAGDDPEKLKANRSVPPAETISDGGQFCYLLYRQCL